MKDESGAPAPSVEPSHRGYDSRPIPDRLLAIFLAVLVVALVLGYLFLNKLVDISSQEDCALAHRKNCLNIEVSNADRRTVVADKKYTILGLNLIYFFSLTFKV